MEAVPTMGRICKELVRNDVQGHMQYKKEDKLPLIRKRVWLSKDQPLY